MMSCRIESSSKEKDRVDTIGIVGLGRMGAPVLGRLVAAGFRVVAYDADASREAVARASGAEWESSLARLAARADAFVTVLPGPQEARAVVEEALENLAPGSLWLDLTSNDPRVTATLARRAEALGIATVGAAMGGGPANAEDGTLTFYLGGDDRALDRVGPVLAALSAKDGQHRAGARPWDGQIVKLLANALWFTHALAATESLLLGRSLGIDMPTLRGTLRQSAGASAFMSTHLDHLLQGDYLESFGLDRVVEELDSVVAMADEAGTPAPTLSTVAALHREALLAYGPIDGELSAARLLEERAGFTLRLPN